jgi:hypothetical protein
MKKHECIYVFYKNLPFYDLSSHKHKFIKTKPYVDKQNVYGSVIHPTGQKKAFDPPLPVSVVKEEKDTKTDIYGMNHEICKEKGYRNKIYDPPLPVSIIKDCYNQKERLKSGKLKIMKNEYDPVLPTSVVKEEKTQITTAKKSGIKNLYGDQAGGTIGNVHGSNFEPKLPTSIVKDEVWDENGIQEEWSDINCLYNKNGLSRPIYKGIKGSTYEPPLPNSLLEIKSQKGKHATQKPTALTDWLLKYFSKEGDIVLDPTMGSGGCGISCKRANRKFIGIEMDPEIFQVAVERINTEN